MFPEPNFIDTGNVRIAVYEQGEGRPVILLHGFPELAYSWRYQLPALAAAGYHAIAPDQRGYGRTGKPAGVAAYSIQALVGDVVAILDAKEFTQAVIVGHDWGALLAWQMALLVPERMAGLVALNVPFLPRPPVDPIALMRTVLGDDFYIVNFQDSDAADRRCDRDPAWVFEVMMRRNSITRERFNQLPKAMRSFSLLAALERDQPAGDTLLSAEDARVYADAFEAGGFTPAINWYRNWTRNWDSTADLDQTVRVPSLFIGAVDDVIISPEQIDAMTPFVPDLETHILENCGHWTQQEKPDDVNSLLIDWLDRRMQGLPPGQHKAHETGLRLNDPDAV
ncbi:alpha/beta fold hydrolase [Gammaproteobacteria bacterium]|jgi:pimeloyl-ACP methyl ester carboxylesterase|nr:alpha/beta fold hydrolase [Gammaproteobacteria bacterium]